MSTENTSPSKPAEDYFFRASASDFNKIPGSPIAYWVSDTVRSLFSSDETINTIGNARAGLTTGDNTIFQRHWFEIERRLMSTTAKDIQDTCNSSNRWFPCNSGGDFRKWFGNNLIVVNWENDGKKIRKFAAPDGRLKASPRSSHYYFKPGVTWSKISSGKFAARYFDVGFIFDDTGQSVFPENGRSAYDLALTLCSNTSNYFLSYLSQTLSYNKGDIARIPIPKNSLYNKELAMECISIARRDWDNFETSWGFLDQPLLRDELKTKSLCKNWANWDSQCKDSITKMQELEAENNRLWIDAYGLQDELTPEVPEKEITLARADPKKDMAAFISYAIGCMFGRYSLDKPGLILANAGESIEDYIRKVKSESEGDSISFMLDDDNIIPVLDGEWFDDDIVARFREFLKVTFGEATLRENIDFIEESLGKELRKYFVTDFYKDHLKTYKKRPIYWLFQSPKKSFQALIYLHRYNRDTVNLLLNDYLREFQEKLKNRRKHLDEILASESTSPRDKTAATKEQTKIDKALPELADWEREEILPLAQQRLEIDLDDGVKVNYPKFGKALAKIPGVS